MADYDTCDVFFLVFWLSIFKWHHKCNSIADKIIRFAISLAANSLYDNLLTNWFLKGLNRRKRNKIMEFTQQRCDLVWFYSGISWPFSLIFLLFSHFFSRFPHIFYLFLTMFHLPLIIFNFALTIFIILLLKLNRFWSFFMIIITLPCKNNTFP